MYIVHNNTKRQRLDLPHQQKAVVQLNCILNAPQKPQIGVQLNIEHTGTEKCKIMYI